MFTELDFIDLIIDDKPIFLISWKTENAHRLKIKSIKKSNYGPNGSVILRLPRKLDQLIIIVSNIWRKQVLHVQLMHTELDTTTASFLLKEIKHVQLNGEIIWRTPLSGLDVHVNSIIIKRIIAGFRNLTPSLKNYSLDINQIKPSIYINPVLQTQRIKYPN